MENQEFLYEMLEAVSVSGHPMELQNIIEKHMQNEADEVRTDITGNTICILNPQSEKKLLITAHADEIGLVVTTITKDGMLTVIRRGGIIPHTYPGQQVKVVTQNGVLYGVVQESRELLKKEDLEAKDFLVDIGVSTEEEAKTLVSIGDMVVPDSGIRKLAGGRFSSRALDDKLGVFIIMEALKRAKALGCSAGIYCAATVGEETTKDGAYFAAAAVQPEQAVVVDVTYTTDCCGTKETDAGRVLLGGGPVLCDSPMVPKVFNQRMMECAKKAGVKVQLEMASAMTYTDLDKIHFTNQGIPCVLMSIPLRYMHSPAEVADEKDVESCIALLTSYFMRFSLAE